MGKGDKKTKKGKIAMGSFGKRRPKKGTLSTGSVFEKKETSRAKAEDNQAAQKMAAEKNKAPKKSQNDI